MYKHILAALDNSPRAPHVLLHAAELAARFGAVLHACRAVQVPAGLPVDAWTLTGDALTTRLRELALRDLAALLTALPTRLACSGSQIARYGAPFEVITTVAREVQADLVVVGSHGFGILDRLLGTTADRVVHRAPCSVLVVRDEVAS